MATKKVQLVSKRRSLSKTKDVNKQVNVQRTRKKKIQDELANIDEKKVIVTRRRNIVSKETSKEKDKKVIGKVQKTNDKPRSSRQMLLKESFSNQPISKRLRPRNDHNDENLVQRSLSPKSQRSSVVLTKITIQEKKPVYMGINANNDSMRNKSDVYDFAFDLNDSNEKIKTKRRRRVIKNPVAKTTKKKLLPQVKIPVSKKAVTNTVEPEADKKNVQKSNVPKKTTWKKSTLKSNKIDSQSDVKVKKATKQIIQTINDEVMNITEHKEECPNNLPENITESIGNTNKGINPKITATDAVMTKDKENKTKPTIRSVEKLHNAKVTVIKPLSESSTENLPLRTINPSNINVNNRIMQNKPMKDYSLLEKSLSPITKALNNFDSGSPWRVPTFSSFSHVRNLFQSTPAEKINNENAVQQIKNTGQTAISTSNAQKGKISSSIRMFGKEITNIDHSTSPNTNVIADRSERAVEHQILSPNNQSQSKLNISLDKYNDVVDDKENTMPNYQTPKKPATRKLRNIKRTLTLQRVATLQSRQKKENVKTESQKRIVSISPKIMEPVSEQKSVESSDLQTNTISIQERMMQSSNDMQFESMKLQSESSSVQKSVTFDEKGMLKETDNKQKENLEPQPGPSGLQMNKPKGILQERNYQEIDNFEPRPGPSGLQKNPIPKLKGILKKPDHEQDTNFEPQPGPSGLQKGNVFKPEGVKRQTKLNNFLNLPEMPENSIIKTAHGIFDDAHSTPIIGKPTKKIKKVEPMLENAFGFAESSDSELDISPINPEEKSNDAKQIKIQKPETQKIPARLSVGEIKNKLLPKKIKQTENKKAEVKKNIEEPVENVKQQTKKMLVNATNFSDTFDIMSETEETPANDVEVPLFVDLEPVHFKQPPRHSYKRKRGVNFNFSEDSAEEEVDAEKFETNKKKKKKISKLNKMEEERLKKWVENVNRTFSEIDQHDLIIE